MTTNQYVQIEEALRRVRRAPPESVPQFCITGLVMWHLTSLPVTAAAVFAMDFVPLCCEHPGSQTRLDWWSALAAWDGEWYVRRGIAPYLGGWRNWTR